MINRSRSTQASVAAAFKEFHRALCERFGYIHDENNWSGDLQGLIAHIAGRLEENAGRDASESKKVVYGCVTTHSVTGQQFFYRWPESPYLDNAKECVIVYTIEP